MKTCLVKNFVVKLKYHVKYLTVSPDKFNAVDALVLPFH